MKKIFVCLALVTCLLSCAHSATDFEAVITTSYAPDGSVTAVSDSTKFNQGNTVTWGSELKEGQGDMDYVWDKEGSGRIKVGGAAKGMEAGDPSELLTQMMQMYTTMSSFQSSQPANPSTRDSIISAIVTDPALRADLRDLIMGLKD